jgi:hypothetical protein
VQTGSEQTKAEGAPEDFAEDFGAKNIYQAKKNRERRGVEKAVGSAGIHGGAIPPVGGGETVVGDDPGSGGVEEQVNRHANKDRSEDGPGEKVPAAIHDFLYNCPLGRGEQTMLLARWTFQYFG